MGFFCLMETCIHLTEHFLCYKKIDGTCRTGSICKKLSQMPTVSVNTDWQDYFL